jgi:hypothetical protein
MTDMSDRQEYDLSALYHHVQDAALWLAIWQNREEPDPVARLRASDAVGAIDAMLLELHDVRARLVGEIRAADDATGVRVDALLAATDALLTAEPDRKE